MTSLRNSKQTLFNNQNIRENNPMMVLNWEELGPVALTNQLGHALTYLKAFILVPPSFDVMSEDRFPVVNIATAGLLRWGMNIICFVTRKFICTHLSSLSACSDIDPPTRELLISIQIRKIRYKFWRNAYGVLVWIHPVRSKLLEIVIKSSKIFLKVWTDHCIR